MRYTVTVKDNETGKSTVWDATNATVEEQAMTPVFNQEGQPTAWTLGDHPFVQVNLFNAKRQEVQDA